MYPQNRRAPSHLLKVNFVLLSGRIKIVKNIIIERSTMVIPVFDIGLIREDIPKILRMLNTLEPTAFPIAISFSFLKEATMEVVNSGKLVPSATIVNPITA